MDIPVWITNEFYNRKLDLKRVLSNSGIKKASITEVKDGKDKFEIKVSFGIHYVKAAEVVVSICKEIFGITDPCVFKYITGRLVQKRSN